jgi:hypothetical protein
LACSTVDLRALRLQMESSLARLHDDFSVSLKLTNASMLLGRKPQPLANFFSPPHARHEEADYNTVHPTENKGVWIKNVVGHCRWRQERGCARMVFLRFIEVTGREKTRRLAKIVSQLQQELDEVEIQLAESYDPARTQARFKVKFLCEVEIDAAFLLERPLHMLPKSCVLAFSIVLNFPLVAC